MQRRSVAIGFAGGRTALAIQPGGLVPSATVHVIKVNRKRRASTILVPSRVCQVMWRKPATILASFQA